MLDEIKISIDEIIESGIDPTSITLSLIYYLKITRDSKVKFKIIDGKKTIHGLIFFVDAKLEKDFIINT